MIDTQSLRGVLIKLAHDVPDLRKHLVPLLRKTAKSFEEMIKNQTFQNPETGNKVKFDSLPAEEQTKIRNEWASKNETKDDSPKKAPSKSKGKAHDSWKDSVSRWESQFEDAKSKVDRVKSRKTKAEKDRNSAETAVVKALEKMKAKLHPNIRAVVDKGLEGATIEISRGGGTYTTHPTPMLRVNGKSYNIEGQLKGSEIKDLMDAEDQLNLASTSLIKAVRERKSVEEELNAIKTQEPKGR